MGNSYSYGCKDTTVFFKITDTILTISRLILLFAFFKVYLGYFFVYF